MGREVKTYWKTIFYKGKNRIGKVPAESEALTGLEAFHLHVTNELIGDFLKNLLGKDVSTGSRVLLELDELDNVTLGCATVLVTEETAIRIKLLHHLELLIADTDDDD